MIETIVAVANMLAVGGLIVELDNFRFFPRLRAVANSQDAVVDVCIAMRNEAQAAVPCCRALLSQEVVRMVLVVDDGSSDGTYELLCALMLQEPRLVVMKSTGSGKRAALAQAAMKTHAPMLFFTDADIVTHTGAIDALLLYADACNVEAVSVWPKISNHSLWDALLCPTITLFLLQALPMRAAVGTDPRFSAANGQALLVRRDAYNAAGGHAALQTIVEDVELAIRLKRTGYRVALACGAALFSSEGYGSFTRAFNGLGRSLYFGLGPVGVMAFGFWQCLAYFTPWVAVCFGYRAGWFGVAVSLTARAALAVRMRHSFLWLLLTPLSGALAAIMAFSAARTGLSGK
ncbi:MAG: glycosyltransferase family 2 protein, partial [Candidatus Eremiobacteraeota bacterium]|nr:glycosyltransferase family 2 protein [Candidatus Eremiobacteraeota bacterium]